jgi:hypothetical protein
MTRLVAAVLALGLAVAACGDDAADAPESVEFDFTTDAQGWEAGFADYPADADLAIYELEAEWRPLPENLDGNALYSRGHNRSDDLLMYWYGAVDGFAPGVTYDVAFTVDLASNVPEGLVGIGGSPGESVFVKAGAAGFAPQVAADDTGWLRIDWDVGNQASGGEDAIVIGTMANPNLGADADGITFELMTLESTEPFSATADDEGRLWLLVATDSGFEGATEVYFDRVVAEFEAT